MSYLTYQHPVQLTTETFQSSGRGPKLLSMETKCQTMLLFLGYKTTILDHILLSVRDIQGLSPRWSDGNKWNLIFITKKVKFLTKMYLILYMNSGVLMSQYVRFLHCNIQEPLQSYLVHLCIYIIAYISMFKSRKNELF